MTVVRDGYMTEGRRSVGEGRSMTVGSLGDDLGADLGDNLGGDRGLPGGCFGDHFWDHLFG